MYCKHQVCFQKRSPGFFFHTFCSQTHEEFIPQTSYLPVAKNAKTILVNSYLRYFQSFFNRTSLITQEIALQYPAQVKHNFEVKSQLLLLQLAGAGNVRQTCRTRRRPSKPALSFILAIASYSKVLTCSRQKRTKLQYSSNWSC